jgi:hypothetical protein
MEVLINTAIEEKTNFEKGYDMLPAKFQSEVRRNIMTECGWSSIMTFHYKRRGKTRIYVQEIPVIEKHFTKHNINPWTGERLSA